MQQLLNSNGKILNQSTICRAQIHRLTYNTIGTTLHSVVATVKIPHVF